MPVAYIVYGVVWAESRSYHGFWNGKDGVGVAQLVAIDHEQLVAPIRRCVNSAVGKITS